ncbi:hypothetical protein [Bacillus sp. FJAT-44742]|uniref:hypothetical protein n=1 Tax=Bacillus sp. FJAT-44742 TaxID=2014005 RepID=UPI000C234A59|nr:hypothetical protein [Bacillus sp. FJAT-44742]
MLLYLTSYILHWVISIFFFLLIPLPFLYKGVDGSYRLPLFKIYRGIIHGAHAGIIIAFITGIILTDNWLSLWTVVVLVNWVAISAFLGLTSKQIRLLLSAEKENKENKEAGDKLFQFSLLLSILIIFLFFIKFSNLLGA